MIRHLIIFLVTLSGGLAAQTAAPRGSFTDRKLQVQELLKKQEFVQARDLAKKLNTEVPDDIAVYGLMADAYMALGDYGEAEKAVQWMLDLRPNELKSVEHTALLRFYFGDLNGAAEMWNAALLQAGPTDSAERIWILQQYAAQQRAAGKPAVAEKLLPGSTKGPSLAGESHDRVVALVDQKRVAEALQVAQAEKARRHDVYTLDAYAWALWAAGKREEAAKVMDEVLAVGIQDAGIRDHAAIIQGKR